MRFRQALTQKQAHRHGGQLFAAAATAAFALTALMFVLGYSAPTASVDATDFNRYAADDGTGFVRPSDSKLDWHDGLSADMRSFLTLPGAGSVRRADQVDNDPERALNAAGFRPMVRDGEMVALWPNCSEIKTSIYFIGPRQDMAAAQQATRAAVNTVAELSGLHLMLEASATTVEDLSLVPATEGNEIQLIWLAAGSPHLEDHRLGETELRFSKQRLEVTSAVVLLSDELLQATNGDSGRGETSRQDTATLAVLHELGHAVGLGHSLDPSSVMAPSLAEDAGVTRGDQSALAYAGTRGCSSLYEHNQPN